MARQFKRGQKAKLSDLTLGTDLYVGVQISGPGMTFDISCFGLDAAERLSDDRYFIFYNQPKSPEEALQQLGAQAGDTESFRITLDRLPPAVDRLAFTATIDGAGTMSQTAPGYLRIVAGGEEVARYAFDGSEFSTERAVMIGDFYRKDGWRFAAVGQGFDGGLEALLKHFGGEVEEEQQAQPQAAPGGAPGFAPPGGAPQPAPEPAAPPSFAPPPGGGASAAPAHPAPASAPAPPAPVPARQVAPPHPGPGGPGGPPIPSAPAQPAPPGGGFGAPPPAANPYAAPSPYGQPQPTQPMPAQPYPQHPGQPQHHPAAPPQQFPPQQPGPAQPQVAGDLRSALDKFRGTVEQRRWSQANQQLIRADLGVDRQPFLARQGSMVLYRGDVEFSFKGGGLKRRLTAGMTGEGFGSLMRCSGSGQVYLAEEQAHLHLVELQGDAICVATHHVLAFDESLDQDVRRIDGHGIPGGSLFALQLSGHGTVVISTRGEPLVLPVTPMTFADANSVVAWSSAAQVLVANQVRLRRSAFPGHSGETTQLQFRGAPGNFAIIQPYEI